jgi:hypothetical protein
VRAEELCALGLPGGEKHLKETTFLEEQTRYEYLAVLQNKKWLIEFLSR